MKILLVYPSGTENIEDVHDMNHAKPLASFGGESYVLNEDGTRTPLADALAEAAAPDQS